MPNDTFNRCGTEVAFKRASVFVVFVYFLSFVCFFGSILPSRLESSVHVSYR